MNQIAHDAFVALYERDNPYPLGSRLAHMPDNLGHLSRAMPVAWSNSRVRFAPDDFPIETVVRKQFRTRHNRGMTHVEIAQWRRDTAPLLEDVVASDEQAVQAFRLLPRAQRRRFWFPVYPLPYADAFLNDIARPLRGNSACFHDLRTLWAAFRPAGPGYSAGPFHDPNVHRRLRVVDLYWIDDHEDAWWLQLPHKSEFAHDAMKLFYEATLNMDADRLCIRIHFPRRATPAPQLTIDSPGIFWLRKIRAYALVLSSRHRLYDDRVMPRVLGDELKRTIEGRGPDSIYGSELASFGVDIRSVGEYGPNGGRRRPATQRRMQENRMRLKYRQKHNHVSAVRRRLTYTRQRARRRVRDLQAPGADANALQQAQAHLDVVEDVWTRVERGLGSYAAKREIRQRTGLPNSPTFWSPRLFPRETFGD